MIHRFLSFFGLSLLISLGIFSGMSMSAEERMKDLRITLVPIGRVDPEVLETLPGQLSKVLNREISISRGLPHPDYAFNRQRNQYLSTVILNTLLSQKEYATVDRVLGIVDHDLYVPELNFVFGEASGKGAVISVTRLRQEFYGWPEDRNLFHKIVLTEAVHELGHTYGLVHCGNPLCVMFFSNSLRDTDRKGTKFCPRCKRKLD